MKMVELKKMEQESKIIEEFVQEFRKIVKRKWIWKKTVDQMKTNRIRISFRNIEQWYEWVTNLDRHWRESGRKEKRLRGWYYNLVLWLRSKGLGWKTTLSYIHLVSGLCCVVSSLF